MRTRIGFALVVLAAVALAGGIVFAQGKAAMAGGKHDLRVDFAGSADYCKACHVPHGSSTTNLGLLWNHGLSTAIYQVWNTTDMPDYRGGPTSVSASSGLCLSCHDGTVAVNVLISNGGVPDPTYVSGTVTGNANLGADLRNDHPVGFTYATSVAAKNAASPGNLATPTAVTAAGLKLFGTTADTGTMECGTCHNVHGGSTPTFLLRKDNAASALCLTCHL